MLLWRGTMAQTFSFPILSDAELLPCLKDMELPLTTAGLAKPTPELVRPVYESVVTTLVGVTRRAPGGSAASGSLIPRSPMFTGCPMPAGYTVA